MRQRKEAVAHYLKTKSKVKVEVGTLENSQDPKELKTFPPHPKKRVLNKDGITNVKFNKGEIKVPPPKQNKSKTPKTVIKKSKNTKKNTKKP